MAPTIHHAAMNAPDLNWQFSRRCVEPADSCNPPAGPPPRTPDHLSAELAVDWRRQYGET